MDKIANATITPNTLTTKDLGPGALGPSRRAGLGLILRAAIIHNDLDLVEMGENATRRPAD
jgi:hypothetical protein